MLSIYLDIEYRAIMMFGSLTHGLHKKKKIRRSFLGSLVTVDILPTIYLNDVYIYLYIHNLILFQNICLLKIFKKKNECSKCETIYILCVNK